MPYLFGQLQIFPTSLFGNIFYSVMGAQTIRYLVGCALIHARNSARSSETSALQAMRYCCVWPERRMAKSSNPMIFFDIFAHSGVCLSKND